VINFASAFNTLVFEKLSCFEKRYSLLFTVGIFTACNALLQCHLIPIVVLTQSIKN